MEGVATLPSTEIAFRRPESVPLHDGMRVEDIEDLDGTPGLYKAFAGRLYEIELTPEQHDSIIETMHFMHELHKGDRRSDGDGLGEGHLLRVTIDLMEAGIHDPEVIKAALLHDAVEDHPREIILKLGQGRYTEAQLKGKSEQWLQQESLRLMAEDEHIGAEAALLVGQVTNEPRDPTRKKNDQYVAQMERLPEKDERAQLIKIMDQFDNAMRNHRTRDVALRQRLDLKYSRTIPIIKNILRGEMRLISTEARLRLLEAYQGGHERIVLRALARSRIVVGMSGTRLTFQGDMVKLAS